MARTPEIITSPNLEDKFYRLNAIHQWLLRPRIALNRLLGRRDFEFAACSGNSELAQLVAMELAVLVDEVMVPHNGAERRHKDGEVEPQFEHPLRGKHVFIFQSFSPSWSQDRPSINDQVMELLLAIDAAKCASAKEITVVMPKMAYDRSDRKDKPRISIGAKVILNCIRTAGADRVVVVDPHKDQIGGFFDGPFDIIYASEHFVPYIRGKFDLSRVVFIASDAGSAKMAGAYSFRTLGYRSIGIIHKSRDGASGMSKSHSYQGPDLSGMIPIFVDEVIAGGGTAVDAAEIIARLGVATDSQGNPEIYFIAPHGQFLGDALDRIRNSPIKRVLTTNSVNHRPDVYDRSVTGGKIEVHNIAHLLASKIIKVHTGETLGID